MRLNILNHIVLIRTLDASEIGSARDLFCRYVDFHARHVVERLPAFFDIARLLDPDTAFAERQRVVVGACIERNMVGAVAIQRTQGLEALDLDDLHPIWDKYSDHDLDVYCTLNESLARTCIGTPPNTLMVHSLAVRPEYRRCGIARSLLAHAIAGLAPEERSSLYIETARVKWLVKICTKLGFSPVRKTLSLSERLEYGYWGSVLLTYQPEGADNHPMQPSGEVGRI